MRFSTRIKIEKKNNTVKGKTVLISNDRDEILSFLTSGFISIPKHEAEAWLFGLKDKNVTAMNMTANGEDCWIYITS